MSPIRQFYDSEGVPLRIDGPPEEPATAWRSQRARVRSWLESLPDPDWAGATRCGLWDVTSLVRHLASGSQFLGYTLHRGAAGTATTLLQGFDPHATVQAAAAMLGEMTPAAAREAMAAMDAAVDRELETMARAGWSTMAEAPPGQLPAHLSVNHFLFDSWVHEYDLMVPRGERPYVDVREASVVVRYLLGLASVTTASETPLDVRLCDPEIRVGVDVANGQVRVAPSVPSRAAVLEGRLVDVVDRATGREAGPIDGDQRALAVLDTFGALLAG
ncbi:MAG TPA: maleylpyruvate isomerase N-terminal domain-containing protein [Mycobacteriales bacterium]|nr:maleylpyruvate isomerase N-terminal domain-containing protein [Mycobacteriales bacterium]